MGILDTLASLPPEQAQGLLATGLGILANNTGHYGAFGPAVGAGGLTGLSNLQSQTALKRKYGLEERQVNILDAYRKQQEAQMQNQLDMMQWAKQHFLSDPALGGQQPAQQPLGQQPAPQQPQGPLPPGTGTVLAPEPQAPASAQAMPQPTAAYDPRIAAARFGMTLGAMKLDPSAILSANEQLYPKGVAQREGAPVIDPFTGRVISPAPLKTTEGLAQRRNPVTGELEYYKPPGADLVLQQAADIERAKIEAKAPLTMAPTREKPSGEKVYLTEKQAIDLTKGTAGPGANATGPTIEGRGYSESLSKARENYTATAMTAQEALPSLQLMKAALVNGLKTNNLAEYTSGFGNWMQSFGIDPTQYGINDPTNVQEFSKGATKLVADMTRALSSREAVQGMMFIKQGNPGLSNTVDANLKLVSLAEGTKLWEIARDQEAQKWADTHGGTTDRFIQNFQMTHPVQKYWQKSYDDLTKAVGVPARSLTPQAPIQQQRPSSPTPFPSSSPLRKRSDGSYDYVPR